MLQTGERAPIRLASAFGLTLVATLAGIYAVSQILRNSIGVIAPDLARDVGLSAAQLGLLSSAFFIAFASVQLPLGIALDRYGPKRCMLVCTGIAILGAVLFAAAQGAGGLVAARVLMGFGSSCYLMAPLAFYARRFAPDRFSTLAGLQLGIGNLGTLVATAPLALSTALMGWRLSFLFIALAMGMAGVLVALVMPGQAKEPQAPGESWRDAFAGALEAARTPSVARLFLMHLSAYSSFVLVLGLWGGPYLAHVYGYSLTARGDVLLLAAIGQTLGMVLSGPLERAMRSHKAPVMLGSGLTAAAFLTLTLFGRLPTAVIALWFFAFGLFTAYSPILIAHGKTLFPPRLIGRGITLLNMGTMVGVFVSQMATGLIIQAFGASEDGSYPVAAYRAAFGFQAGFILVSMLVYARTRDPAHENSAH